MRTNETAEHASTHIVHTHPGTGGEQFTLFVSCHECGHEIALTELARHLVDRHRQADPTPSRPQHVVPCPGCGAPLEESVVSKHMRKVHEDLVRHDPLPVAPAPPPSEEELEAKFLDYSHGDQPIHMTSTVDYIRYPELSKRRFNRNWYYSGDPG